MKRIKIGIIGTGFSAAAHVEALRRIPFVDIVAVAGTSMGQCTEFSNKMNIPKTYETADQLIEDPDVQAIHNCTPNYVHYDINKKVLLANKHLLSEKPLAINSAQAEELAKLANQSTGVSGVCFNYRHYPMVAQAKELFHTGHTGKVNTVYGGYLQDWLSQDTDYSWRLDESKNGPSRAIADIGSHWCDTVEYVLNKKIVDVFADLMTVHPTRKRPKTAMRTFVSSDRVEREDVEIHTEDCGNVLIRFDDGTQGVFTVSQVTAGRKNRLYFEISAERSTISWDQEKPNELWIGQRSKSNELWVKDPELLSAKPASLAHYPGGHQEGWPDGLKNLCMDFYAAVANSNYESSFASFADGHRIMVLIEAILESHKEKRWVSL